MSVDNLLTIFRIVAMVVGFCFGLMFFFVPETFWDRTPRPNSKSRRTTLASLSRIFSHDSHHEAQEGKPAVYTGGDGSVDMRKLAIGNSASAIGAKRATIAERRQQRNAKNVGFADQDPRSSDAGEIQVDSDSRTQNDSRAEHLRSIPRQGQTQSSQSSPRPLSLASHEHAFRVEPRGEGPQTPDLHSFNSPFYVTKEGPDTDYLSHEHLDSETAAETPGSAHTEPSLEDHNEKSPGHGRPRYTHFLRTQPPKTYRQTLKPWNGRLRHENWFLVALRPLILFAYPSILWSTLVYSLSIGWLIVLSESVSTIFQNKETYNFSALQTGLVYISPFVGGVLGTAVAGKVSDIIVRYMSRRNGGVYEPEFRLVMAIPITISTCIGLIGYGWSVQERDNWIVPTIFFGVISFGCALGSTTSITFAVDSYRQYAGEALVTLNFSKSKFPKLDKAAYAYFQTRHLPRPCVLPLLQSLVGCRWLKEYLCSYWRHSVGLFSNNCADVHLWQKGAYVDCEEELYGEILKPIILVINS
jgi:hypothetical protein